MGTKEIYGFTGKILRVDLTTETISIEPTMEYARKGLGGQGINARILYDEVKPWVTPYEPANKLLFGAGPLIGTLTPAACRLSVGSKNVFSHGIGSASMGGHFASEMKFAGYDLIICQGRARRPVYLWIDDDHVTLKDARGVWGKTTWETDDLIKEEIGDEDIQILSIGPAGENLVKMACIMGNRNRAAGKCGLGAIMGSKNLKAVAVRGTGSVEVAHPARFMQAVDHYRGKLEKSELMKTMSEAGTISGFIAENDIATVPYKNFQGSCAPEEVIKSIHPDIFLKEYKVKNFSCAACPIHCSNYYRVDHGVYAGLKTEGFQLDTIANFGSKLALDYAPAVIKGFTVCNQLGMDTVAASGVVGWAFECYQRGILTQKDTDGLKLEWGDHGVVFELMRKLAHREGFGNILAEGSKCASEIIGRGSGYYAMHVKGQDVYEEIRSPIGWGLGSSVATRGGGHTTGSPLCEQESLVDPEMGEAAVKFFGIKTLDPTVYEGKPKLVVYFERFDRVVSSLGLCMFVGAWYDFRQISFGEAAELYSAATGLETTEEELIKISDRILNLEKAFNVLHANLDRKDDLPPERLLKEPISAGPYKGHVLSKEQYDKMLDEYYKLRGWNPDSGLQTRKCLKNLDLANVADDLERAHKL